MQPIIKVIMAESKTADADISFTFFIVRLKSGETRLQSFSIAEFIISKPNTTAKHRRIVVHSFEDNPKKKPPITTTKASMYWILKFFSCRIQSFKPLNAHPNDLITRIVFFNFLSYK